MNDLVSFDYAIKYLLKDKGDYDIVEGFISALISKCGYRPIKIKALLEPASNKEGEELKSSIADLIVEDDTGNKYIVEIDRSHTSSFLDKACFNSSRLIVDSISSNDDYSKIQKIIHINLLYFPFGNIKAPLHYGKTIFHEIDKTHPHNLHILDRGIRFFDIHNIFPEYFVISLPLFNDIIKDELDEWLYMMKHSEVKKNFKSPYMKKVADKLNILKMTPEKRREYSSYHSKSLKERDYILGAEEKGRDEGIEIGKAEEKIAIAKAMLLDGDSLEKIAKITNLSITEIRTLHIL